MSIKLLKDLDFASKLNAKEAITEAGKDFLRNYRGYCYSNPVTCGVVNSFVNEAKQYGFDSGLMSILGSVVGFINENNISWKLSSACESIANNKSSYNYIAKTAINKVDKLLEMNEAEVVSYIKAGVLKDVQYVTEFRNICKEVYGNSNQITEYRNAQFEVSNGVSYVFKESDNSQYFMVNGKTFKFFEGKVSEGECNNETFLRINNLISNMTKVDESLVYEYKNSFAHNSNKFTINEEGVEISRGGATEKFDNVDKFNEYCNTISTMMPLQEKLTFLQVSKAIGEVYENFANICEIDQVKTVVTNEGAVCSIIEGKDNVLVNVIASSKVGNGCEDFATISEALKLVEKATRANISGLYENRIVNEAKKANPEDVEEIKKQVKGAKDAKRKLVEAKIAKLAEEYKNDPVRIAILNKCAKELALLD